MVLTRDFKETIRERVERDSTFREALLTEGIECLLVWCLTNTVMKMRGHFGCRQGAMTCRGDRRSPPWWRAPREEDPGSSPE